MNHININGIVGSNGIDNGFNKLNFNATKIKIKRPLINVGSDVPTRTNTVEARSCHLPFLLAAITPSRTPTLSQSVNAPIAKLKVTGKASLIKSVTHAWRLNEYPKAGAGHSNLAAPSPYSRPTNKPLTNRPY